MSHVGQILKQKRLDLNLTIATVAIDLSMDTGLLSKIERGVRLCTRKQINLFVNYYKLEEKELITNWLSDKVLYELKDEEYGLEALRVAEAHISYGKHNEAPNGYSPEIDELIYEVDELKKKWLAQKPLNQLQLKKMQEHFNLSYAYESNRIEGNTLTLQETYLVVNDGLTIGGKTVQEHLEAINHIEATDFIADLIKNKEAFSEKILNEIHFLILKGIDKSNAGVYRKVPVTIGGSNHLPPQPYLIKKKMEEVFEYYYLNKPQLHPVILAAEMHQKIVTVHPYIDGNGRTSRLIMNLILLMNGYTIAILKGGAVSRQAYYDALESSRTENSASKFYQLILKATITSLKEHLSLAK